MEHQASRNAREVATEQEEERVRHGPNDERTEAREREARKAREETPDPTECGAFREVAPRHETVGSKKKRRGGYVEG